MIKVGFHKVHAGCAAECRPMHAWLMFVTVHLELNLLLSPSDLEDFFTILDIAAMVSGLGVVTSPLRSHYRKIFAVVMGHIFSN